MLVCVHGNIGVGKTTMIQNQNDFKTFNQIIEPIQDWDLYFQKYYQSLNKGLNGNKLNLKEQCDLIEFQILTTLSRLQTYQKIEQNNIQNYIFERSIQESNATFCPILKQFLENDQKQLLDQFMEEAIKYEPHFDKDIYLKASSQELMKRIKERNRPGEQYITEQFIEELNKLYTKFNQKQIKKQSINSLSQIYVIGSVGVGKTTFIKNIENVVKKIQNEPLQFWGDYLQKHQQNQQLYKNGERNLDQFNNTFLFQLKVIVSRLKFQTQNSLVERCILEEPYVFVPQYKELFSDSQYKLIMNLYDFVSTYILKIADQTVFYIDIPLEQEYQNILKRNRNNENEIYTMEMLKEMKIKYQKMLDLEVFQKIKQRGKLYQFKWNQ